MAMQYLQSNHPLPDYITFVPQSVFRAAEVGYNPAHLLANHLGQLLGRPVLSLLKRSSPLLRQTQLSMAERYRLSVSQFQWKKHIPLKDKTLLLVDDQVGTGATLRACEKRLKEAFPDRIIKAVSVGTNLL
jgi:competence protein ComFC